MNRALIIVDMQVDFVTGSLGTKEAERIVPAVVKKIETEKKTEHRSFLQKIHMKRIICKHRKDENFR